MISRYHARYYAALLSRQTVGDQLDSLSQSLLSSTVDINPHQIDAALFAFKSPFSKGVVLADEVGLGKTIEAGLVLCQYWATGRRKIVVVCPASLRKQWEAELCDKFGIPSEILDTKNYNAYQRAGKNPLSPKRVIICSYNFAGRHKGDLLTHGFDLAVIDEAHKLRNVYRKSAKTVADVRDALYGVKKLLLTATPFQNSLMELYGLTSVIDDRLFGSEKSFRATYGKGEDLEDLRRRIAPYYTRTLRKDVREYIRYTNRLPLTQKFEATDDEFRLYNDLSDFLRRDDIYTVPASQRKLTTMIIRKIMASSSYALVFTLENIKARLMRMLEKNAVEEFHPEDLIDEDDWSVIDEDEQDHDFCAEPALFDEEQIDTARLKTEILTIEGFIQRAKGIKEESKAKALLKALDQAFKKLEEQGAQRKAAIKRETSELVPMSEREQARPSAKALIFTESTKTQAFLQQFLEANGFAGRTVAFNGSVRNVEQRAALIRQFQNEADIMIATEAAAEGLNLQFCSLVINFDLPWNPQRIEQRIGRCHRYGQHFDVVVVNFINIRNYADVRVFELLSTKFKLFDDVFGASDEVLGKADSVDVENRIWQIYQQCRSKEEIDQAFDQLQAEMHEEIDQRMQQVRQEVMEHFDINVQEHLRTTRDATGIFLNRYQHIFWELTKFVLSAQAVFNDEQHTFLLKVPVAGQKTGLYAMLSNQQDAMPYRLSDPLGQHVVNTALSLSLDSQHEVIFDEDAISMNASLPDYLLGEQGTLLLSSLDIDAMEDEQYTLFTAVTDSGRQLSQDDCEKLFLNGGTETPCDAISEQNSWQLQTDMAQHMKAKLQDIDSRNLSYFRQEENRIYQWEHDVLDGIERELDTVKRSIQQAEREARAATTVQEKLQLERSVEDLKRKKRRLRNELDDREDEVAQQRKQMLSELEQRMVKSTEQRNIFLIRWRVKTH